MEYRPLDLTVISAKDLNDVNLFNKMDVYVTVSINGDRKSKQKTPVDKQGGKNPTWNFPMKFHVDEISVQQNTLFLHFLIRCDRTLGDKDVGEVHVSVKELLDSAAGDDKSAKSVSYQVGKPSGKPRGVLNFSFKFGDKVVGPTLKSDEPVTAYPVTGPGPGPSAGPYPYPAKAAGYGYGGPPAEYGYGGPPPPGYGAPPAGYGYGGPPPPRYGEPQQGYGYGGPPPPGYGGPYGYPPQGNYGGYPPVVQPQRQQQKNNRSGMGLGMGLLGGALGGLLIGDMISDGFGGGFDF
ncbi:protein SRC2-like [Tasmannia lanceolata]|uniref:protein SRC2-like n=1 Tax=Tasmannia lanceolata TaxID=3420 RepID=UPI004063C598